MEPSQTPGDSELSSARKSSFFFRCRWWVHLVLLTAYPIMLGVLSTSFTEAEQAPILPRSARALLIVGGSELLIFGFVFALACLASRPSVEQLYLKWRGGIWPVIRGLGYSIALRVLIVAAVMIVVLVAYAAFGLDEAGLKRAMPRTEAVVDPAALTKDPLYFLLMLTFVSFIVAGLREELWRAGMLAGLRALFPKTFESKAGGIVAAALVAVAFGLGHLPQGWSGVALTTLLGAGLGAIIVLHRSIWDAVLAHGFFDASTFVMLYLIAKFAPQVLPGG